MLVIAGLVILTGCVIWGFTHGGGRLGELFHIGEIVPLVGLAIGTVLIMSPIKVLKGLVHASLGTLKGPPYKKADYEELFKCLYELFLLGRRGGMIALEEHVMNPHGSSLFKKYPKFHSNHHAVEFLSDGLKPIVDGRIKPDQLEPLMASTLHTMHEEHHAPVIIINKLGDSMPAFGIVAAVLGIVLVMGKIGGPVTEVGGGIASALTGTFLGIFAAYAVLGPMATNIEFNGHAEMAYLKCIKVSVVAFANGLPPLVAAEVGRRTLEEDVRPTSGELETMLKTLK